MSNIIVDNLADPFNRRDTVSSVGVTRGPSLPETTHGMKHVCHVRHALSLDEERLKFLPEYVNGGLGPDGGPDGDVQEVWFVGSHSDMSVSVLQFRRGDS